MSDKLVRWKLRVGVELQAGAHPFVVTDMVVVRADEVRKVPVIREVPDYTIPWGEAR